MIEKILKEFVLKCSKKLDLYGLIQFGSSAYSKNFHDIDLILLFNEEVVSINSISDLIKIIKEFERKYKEVVFDFGGVGDRKRIGKYSITTVFLGKKELSVKHNPNDLFFFKNLSEDKNIKILLGKNPFQNKKFELSNQHLFEMLSVGQKHSLRKSLDDKKSKLDSFYFLFKTFLRAMLINYGVFEKKELLKKFKEVYKNKIILPKNSEKIISNKLIEKDVNEILIFTNKCLEYLSKHKAFN